MKFNVTVRKEEVYFADIEIDAEDEEMAQEKALNLAKTGQLEIDFDCLETNYSIE